MFFTKFGRVIAWLMFVLATFRIAMGFSIATFSSSAEQMAFFTKRYLGSGTTGQAIDQGGEWLLIAVALGILVEISTALGKKRQIR